MLWDNHRRGLPILNFNEHTNSEGHIWEKRGGGGGGEGTCRLSDAKKKKKTQRFPILWKCMPESGALFPYLRARK